MDDYKIQIYLPYPQPYPIRTRKMPAPTPRVSNLTALLHTPPTEGEPTLVRDSVDALGRLRHTNMAEIITLFTPLVPHPPDGSLAKDMDPFEPLGRALPRQVRHVPYRPDHGMTETHVDFLPTSGAIVVVMCCSPNVLSYDAGAFEKQAKFARDILTKAEEDRSLANVPVILLLVSNGPAEHSHESGVMQFPTLLKLKAYSAAALTNAVDLLFRE